MDSYKFQKMCKEFLIEYYKDTFDIEIGIEDCYVVWSCKTLQNNKCLMSTTIKDKRYCEFTYNGDKNEIYFDLYRKEINIPIEVAYEV